MSDNIKVGDRFLVEVEVTGFANQSTGFMPCKGRLWSFHVPGEELRFGKRLPPALKVGDRVRDIDVAGVAVILALHGERAWVTPADDDGDEGWITHLSDLRLAEEAR